MRFTQFSRSAQMCLLAAVFALSLSATTHVCATAFSTDQSDLWWVPSESGWGMQLVHRGSLIFPRCWSLSAPEAVQSSLNDLARVHAGLRESATEHLSRFDQAVLAVEKNAHEDLIGFRRDVQLEVIGNERRSGEASARAGEFALKDMNGVFDRARFVSV